LAVLLVISMIASAAFALEPGEVLVVVNADEPKSVSIGSYYLRRRNLPQSNIVPLRLGRGALSNISREDYVEKVERPLRRLLAADQYAGIRCLLTTFNMPFRIAAPVIDEKSEVLISDLEEVAADNLQLLEDGLSELSDEFSINYKNDLEKNLSLAAKHLRHTMDMIKATEDAELRERKIDKFLEISLPLYGAFVVSQLAAVEFDSVYRVGESDIIDAQASRELVGEAVSQGWSYRKCLDNDYYRHFAKVYGVLQLLEMLDDSINKIKGVDMSAALDSELAMVRAGGYELYKWRQSPLREDLNAPAGMMVSRIDGPSERVCRGIIDKSIAAERDGLKGSVCIDAGFMDAGRDKSFRKYDESLLKTAGMFEQAGFDVVLENTPAIFTSQKPLKTAFYCGWYSLGNYVDSFDFAPGAVGYHISSFEAVDIRDPGSGQWVASMLNDGIAATLGAVDEPYLRAFPLPEEFFARLLEGYTVAQAYAKTNPYNSWQLLLIADPLYRPCKVVDE
jgi:uncharacterized protein (TIGR03790 family)